jgi:hypothetical protein
MHRRQMDLLMCGSHLHRRRRILSEDSCIHRRHHLQSPGSQQLKQVQDQDLCQHLEC